MEPVQDRGWHPRAELRVAIERVTDEVQGTHLLAYHLLVVEELQQVKVCDSHTKLVWEDGQSAREGPGIGGHTQQQVCTLTVPSSWTESTMPVTMAQRFVDETLYLTKSNTRI